MDNSIDRMNVELERTTQKLFNGLPMGAVMLLGLRYRDRLTQAELGALMGIDETSIDLIEQGKQIIGLDMAKKLAIQFNTDYALFIDMP